MGKREILRAAKKLWPKCRIVEDRQSTPPKEKERLQSQVDQLDEQKAECDSILESLPDRKEQRERMMAAAQNVIDTSGKEIIFVQELAEIKQAADEFDSAIQRRSEIEERRKRLRGKIVGRFRFSIYVDSGMFRHVKAQADTLSELAFKVQSAGRAVRKSA